MAMVTTTPAWTDDGSSPGVVVGRTILKGSSSGGEGGGEGGAGIIVVRERMDPPVRSDCGDEDGDEDAENDENDDVRSGGGGEGEGEGEVSSALGDGDGTDDAHDEEASAVGPAAGGGVESAPVSNHHVPVPAPAHDHDHSPARFRDAAVDDGDFDRDSSDVAVGTEGEHLPLHSHGSKNRCDPASATGQARRQPSGASPLRNPEGSLDSLDKNKDFVWKKEGGSIPLDCAEGFRRRQVGNRDGDGREEGDGSFTPTSYEEATMAMASDDLGVDACEASATSAEPECRPRRGGSGVGFLLPQKDEVEAAGEESEHRQSTVTFSTLTVRYYEVVLGDNPACSSGPPISIGWKYDDSATERDVPVDRYERHRARCPPPPIHKTRMKRRVTTTAATRRQLGIASTRPRVEYSWDLVVSRTERERRLLDEWGYNRADLARAVAAANAVKHCRRNTAGNDQLMPLCSAAEEAWEGLRKWAGRATGLRRGSMVLYDQWRDGTWTPPPTPPPPKPPASPPSTDGVSRPTGSATATAAATATDDGRRRSSRKSSDILARLGRRMSSRGRNFGRRATPPPAFGITHSRPSMNVSTSMMRLSSVVAKSLMVGIDEGNSNDDEDQDGEGEATDDSVRVVDLGNRGDDGSVVGVDGGGVAGPQHENLILSPPPEEEADAVFSDLRPFAVVDYVAPRSPADEAGLRRGDHILCFGWVTATSMAHSHRSGHHRDQHRHHQHRQDDDKAVDGARVGGGNGRGCEPISPLDAISDLIRAAASKETDIPVVISRPDHAGGGLGAVGDADVTRVCLALTVHPRSWRGSGSGYIGWLVRPHRDCGRSRQQQRAGESLRSPRSPQSPGGTQDRGLKIFRFMCNHGR